MKLFVFALVLSTILYADLLRDSSNGVVTDTDTGLIWQDDANNTSTMYWDAAINTCETYTGAGKEDWRLPNVNELLTLVEASKTSRPKIKSPFENAASANYWTATNSALYATHAWFVDFYFGYNAIASKSSSLKYVRCVRGGALTVDSTYPEHNATDVGPYSPIQITFSEAMKTSNLSTATITVNNGVTGIVRVSDDSKTATFYPSSMMPEDTNITVTVGKLVNTPDLSKRLGRHFSFSFKTGKKSVVLKTGQTTEYISGDDGTYQKGTARSYTRDDVNGTVTDNATGLIWQDNETVQKMWLTQANYDAGNYSDTSGDTATTYCSDLALEGETDWRLPSREELITLIDYGASSSPSIDTTFQNISSGAYWSATTFVFSGSYAWFINFTSSTSSAWPMNMQKYVKCVRDRE